MNSPPLTGQTTVPGDKSIAHRALMMQCLCAPNVSRTIHNLPPNADVLATLDCLKQLGIQSSEAPNHSITLTTPNIWPLPPTAQPILLDAKNSGTTMRLLSGLLSGLNQHVGLQGDASLSQRPMQRILTPLSSMGASIQSTQHQNQQTAVAPLTLIPRETSHPHTLLKPLDYTLPIASAQVKSSILLAGLFADGTTQVTEHVPTRDHTERMLNAMGVPVTTKPLNNADGTGQTISVTGPIQPLSSGTNFNSFPFHIPGDISSAIFLLALAAIIPNSQLKLTHIGLNPGRTGALEILKQWGADITITNTQTHHGEPVGDIALKYTPLSGDITLNHTHIPALVDELPILAIIAAFTSGTFTVSGAEELRHKECDRLSAIEALLSTVNIPITMTPDGFTIKGKHPSITSITTSPKTAPLQTFHDHRIGLCWHVLNHILQPNTQWPLDHPECINVSFPNFPDVLSQLTMSS